MVSYRIQRLQHRIKELVAFFLRSEYGSGYKTVYIEEVILAADYSVAQVFVTGIKGEQLSQKLLQTLNQRKARVQSEIAKTLRLRRTPKIVFRSDARLAQAMKTLELIERVCSPQ